MANKIVHWELMGPDGKALQAFYADLFDWTSELVPGFDEYFMIEPDAVGVGGAVGKGSPEMPQYQIMYIEVPDVDAHLARAQELGGQTVTPKTVVPGTVTFGMFTDPAGNLVGVVESEVPPAE